VKRYSEYILLSLLILFLFLKGIIPGWTKVHSDFSNYYVSAKLISDHQSLDRLYDNDWFKKKAIENGAPEPGKFSPFPPATAWVMLPLTGPTILTAQRAFLFCNLFFLLIGILALMKITQWSWQYCSIFILLSGLGIANNFAFGQVYLIMTVSILFCYLWMKKGRVGRSGAILAAFTTIKYFPVVFIAGYFLEGLRNRKNIQLIVVFFLFLVVFLISQFLFFGSDLMNEFFNSSLLPHLDGELDGQNLYSFQFQSWDNLFRNLFVFHAAENPTPLINWPAGKSILKIIVYAVVAISTLLVLFKNKNSQDEKKQIIFLSIPSLAALVILPASATYHFVLLVIPLALLLSSGLLRGKTKIVIVIIYLLIGFIPYGIFFRLANSYGVLFAYPRLLLLTILYLVVFLELLRLRKNEASAAFASKF
jgi:hypothetical protein